MFHISCNRLLCAVVFVPFAISSTVARTPTSILVKFDIQVPGLTSHWGQRSETVHRTVRVELPGKLQRMFRYWEFTGSDSVAHAIFSLGVVEKIENELAIELRLSVQGDQAGEKKSWSAVWMPPGDVQLRGYPPSTSAADTILKVIQTRILEKYGTEIREYLQTTIPIAASAQWLDNTTTGEPRIVLPLKWNDYSELSLSEFRLSCEWRAKNARASLRSFGTGMSGVYKPAAPDAPYDALVVIARKRTFAGQEVNIDQSIRNELIQLTPQLIYLEKSIQPDVFLLAEDTP